MPISRLLQNSAFEPAEVEALTEAFERICRELKLARGVDDSMRELVARKVIGFAECGSRNQELVRASVLTEVQKVYQLPPSASPLRA
jgi:hypothetical protein